MKKLLCLLVAMLMVMGMMVACGGAGDDVTEGLDDNFSIQYTLDDSIKGFYNGEYSLVDIINSFNAGMPLIPVCYRYGLTTCDVALEINEISSVSDPFFGISMIGSKR